MFPTLGLFGSIACPDTSSVPLAVGTPAPLIGGARKCRRFNCPFAHDLKQCKPDFPPLTRAQGKATTSNVAPVGTSNSAARSTATTSTARSTATTSKPTVATASTSKPSASKTNTSVINIATRGNTTYASTSSTKSSVKGKTSADLVTEFASNGCPRIIVRHAGALHTPVSTRQKLLQNIYNRYLELYASLATDQIQQLASKDSLAEEAQIYTSASSSTYRNSIISTLARLKKRLPIQSEEDLYWGTGTMPEWNLKRNERLKIEAGAGAMTSHILKRYHMSKSKMEALDYIMEIPQCEVGSGGGEVDEDIVEVKNPSRPVAHGELQNCARCQVKFIVTEQEIPGDVEDCKHHWGRLRSEMSNGEKQRIYSCCRLPVGSTPCAAGQHVFHEKKATELHTRSPFKVLSRLKSSGQQTSRAVVGIDCELVYTTAGLTLARVTVVAPSLLQVTTTEMKVDTILDEFVRLPQQARVLDLLTRFSGIQSTDVDPRMGAKVKFDIAGIQQRLVDCGVGEETTIVGHGLENDLKALRLIHDKCIDTVDLFPHPRGPPLRMSLKQLAIDHLKLFIQDSDPTVGHDSAEDAAVALKLLRYKILKDQRLHLAQSKSQ